MVKINDKESESLSEYLILTGWIKIKPEEVSLKANLGNIELQYPYMTARMQCIVGEEMAIAAGRNGILTMIPRSLSDEDKRKIINANNKVRLKKGDIEFQENPEFATPESSLGEVVKQVERTGHSVVPILDRKSKLYGVYIHDPEHPLLVPLTSKITEVMHKLSLKPENENEIIYLTTQASEEEIRKALELQKRKFVPIVDSQGVLQKIAFLQKFNTNYIGMAISTRQGWEEEIEKYASLVDTLCIDSSNACFEDAIKILRYAKQKFPDKPFGIGNIIQARDFEIFAEAGADYIIGGMGVGSICKTGSERGNGRGQFTVARELAEARDKYFKEKGKYVYFVLDGGIKNVKDMIVALTFADFIMLGNYFNKFHEAVAQKFDANKQLTSNEALMKYVESWGEGHPRARLVAMYGLNFRKILAGNNQTQEKVSERYGHITLAGATTEGVVGLVPYRGRLKPCVERDARYIRTTISNSGAIDLKSFKEIAILEKASEQTQKDMLPHDLEVTEE